MLWLDTTETPGMSRRFLWPIIEVRRGRGWVMLYLWAGRTIRTWTLRNETVNTDEAAAAVFMHAQRSAPSNPEGT